MTKKAQWVNITPGDALERCSDIADDRTGDCVILRARLFTPEEGVLIGFEVHGPLHEDWSVSKADDAGQRKVFAKLAGSFAGVNGANVVVAKAATDKNGEATVELRVSKIGLDVHAVKAYVLDGLEQGAEKVSDEYETWRRIILETWIVEKGFRGLDRVGGLLEATTKVDVGPLQGALYDVGIDVVEDHRGPIPRVQHVYSTDKTVSGHFGTMGTLHGGISASLLHAPLLEDEVVEKNATLSMTVVKGLVVRTLPKTLFRDESVRDTVDWLKAAWGVWVSNGKVHKTVVDPKYLASTGPNKIAFDLGEFAEEWKIANGLKLHLVLRVRYSDGLNGVCSSRGGRYVIVAESTMSKGKRDDDGRQGTLVHEVGHALGLTDANRKKKTVENGDHCAKDAVKTSPPGAWNKSVGCVMGYGYTRPKTYCDLCRDDLKRWHPRWA